MQNHLNAFSEHAIKYTIHRNRSQSLNKSFAMIVCRSTRIYRWEEIYREGSDGYWEKKPFSLTTFLHVPCHGISWQNPKSIVLPNWVLITMDCDGMIPYSMVKRLITMAVIGTEEDDDNKAPVYVKGVKNANGWWIYSIATIWSLRPWMLIIDSLNNLDVTKRNI